MSYAALAPPLDTATINPVIPIQILTSTSERSAGVTLAWQALNVKASFGKTFPDNLAGDVLVGLENFNRAWRSCIQGSSGPKLLKIQFMGPLYDAAAATVRQTVQSGVTQPGNPANGGTGSKAATGATESTGATAEGKSGTGKPRL